jgi:peptide/nickel transport system substrate-binding protein
MSTTRRLFHCAAGIALTAVVLSAPAMAQSAQATTTCSVYIEAPGLALQVQQGLLPPVAERLPLHPRVVDVAEGPGTYGGTMYDLYDGTRLAEFRSYGYENLVRWSPDGSSVVPNIAEGWDIVEGGREYVFHLREGMKWSDGHPFTAADIVFWWDRVETNRDINPGGPYRTFVVDGEPATVRSIDDHTVSFSWSKPNGLFLQNLSTPYGVRVTQFPKHYLEQFDNASNPDGVARMMAQAGQTAYGAWWISRVGTYGQRAEYDDPARPSLQPWIPTTPYVGAQQFTFVRNPYYFKVDPACQQLPYIDERVFTLAPDPELRLLKTIGGEASISRDDISTSANRAVFFDNQSTGNYRFVDVDNSNFNTLIIHLQLNHADEQQAAILQNKDFRVGMSLAMDRQAVIDTVFFGQGEPFQQGPRPNTPFYNEQLGTQYTEYDVATANEMLDRVMPQRNAAGQRLRPDGQPFRFAIMVNATSRPYMVDALQLLQRDWAAVGIAAVVVSTPDDTFWSRRLDPAIDGFVWLGENGTGLLPLLAADFDAFTPEAAYGWIAWRQLNQNPNASVTAEPVVPPPSVQRQYEIMGLLPQTGDAATQAELMKELLQISADDFYTIGLSLPFGDYYVANNGLRNIPPTLMSGWLYPGPAPANFETFFFE